MHFSGSKYRPKRIYSAEWTTRRISNFSHRDENEVNERPDPQTTKGQKLRDPEPRVTKVEAINTQGSEEKRQDHSGPVRLIRNHGIGCLVYIWIAHG